MKTRVMVSLLCGMSAVLRVAAAPATVTERDVVRQVVADPLLDRSHADQPPRKMTLREVVLENEYIRVLLLPRLGGRIAEVFDKTCAKQMFAVRPIEWPPARYSAYGSQLGGIEINFPCFHHGNQFMDQWNWLTRLETDGTATVFVGWTERDSRQRVVARIEVRPGENAVRCRYRFFNLNVLSTGFAPYINTMPSVRPDLRYIWPTQHVVPHGFNNGSLDVLPWPWPDFDGDSVCYKRNAGKEYGSVFGLLFEEDFHGLYYEDADYGMARLFDRAKMPGVKLWNGGSTDKQPGPDNFLEVWASPCLLMEDVLWWEALGVREYADVYYPVHGIGGYRYANETGALNLERSDSAVEIGVYVTRLLPSAVVSLSSVDGAWWRTVTDLAPDKPLRHTVDRAPGRAPLEVRVADADGKVLIRYEHRPDPGLRTAVSFTGKPLWTATPEQKAFYAEQYQPLWRGPTGGYGGYGAPGIAGWRKLLEADANHTEARLGLARSLLMDAQLRRPEKPRCGTAEDIAKLTEEHYAEVLSVLAPIMTDPLAATLAGETHLRKGDPKSAIGILKKVSGDAEAASVLAKAYAMQGDAKSAAKAIRPALRAFPNAPPVVHLAAGLAVLNGNPKEALPLLDRLYEADPLDPVTVFLRVRALGGAGDKEGEKTAREALAALQAQVSDPVSRIEVKKELNGLGLGALTEKK